MLALKVILAEFKVIEVHGKTHILQDILELILGSCDKAVKGINRLRDIILDIQSVEGFEGSLSCLHRVDDILLDVGDLLICEVSVEKVNLGGTNLWTVSGCKDLYALGS